MAFKPLVKVIDLITGFDYISTTADVKLRPFGSTVGQINCSRLGSTNSYYADTDVDESLAYYVMVDIGGGFIKRGMIFDDNVAVEKLTAVDPF